MSKPDLLYEVRGNAAWMTINRESKRNALNSQVIELFHRHLDTIEKDDHIRVVCLTGAGDKSFCAGGDLGAMSGNADPKAVTQQFADLLKRLHLFPKPLIARINGDCLAGGLGPMLSCDMAYAREGVRFGTPEVKVGVFPMMIAALILRNMSRKKAKEMIFTGRLYSSVEAEGMGMITRSCPDNTLDENVEKVLEEISNNGPMAIKAGRQALAAVEDIDFGPSLDLLCDQLNSVMQTEDAAEGMRAFIEKRKPVWKNK